MNIKWCLFTSFTLWLFKVIKKHQLQLVMINQEKHIRSPKYIPNIDYEHAQCLHVHDDVHAHDGWRVERLSELKYHHKSIRNNFSMRAHLMIERFRDLMTFAQVVVSRLFCYAFVGEINPCLMEIIFD